MGPQRERRYYVYILASHSGTLYVGVTGNLCRRIWQHKEHVIEGFTAQYDVTRLLYFEVYHESSTQLHAKSNLRAGGEPKRSRSSKPRIRSGKT
jgi:putative endonuclease